MDREESLIEDVKELLAIRHLVEIACLIGEIKILSRNRSELGSIVTYLSDIELRLDRINIPSESAKKLKSEVCEYRETLNTLLIEGKVSPETYTDLLQNAEIWTTRLELIAEDILIHMLSRKEVRRPPPPPPLTKAVAYLYCTMTGEKVRIPSYIILGRNPKNNKLTIYDNRGNILYTFRVEDRYVTRNSPRVGKYGNTAIYYQGGRWLVEDLNSTNGTLINGRQIPPRTPIPLRNGDTIEIGLTKLIFQAI